MTSATSQLNLILSLLPNLSAAELAQVKAAIDHLSPANASPTALYEALTACTGVKMPFSRFAASRRGSSWLKAEAAFIGFMDETWPGLTKKIEREVGMHFLLGLLASDLKRMKVPVTIGTMTYHMVNIPQVFDRQFPGYRQNGLARLLRPKVGK